MNVKNVAGWTFGVSIAASVFLLILIRGIFTIDAGLASAFVLALLTIPYMVLGITSFILGVVLIGGCKGVKKYKKYKWKAIFGICVGAPTLLSFILLISLAFVN